MKFKAHYINKRELLKPIIYPFDIVENTSNINF